MTRSVNAIDFWRGFALVTIFINHVPGIWYERLTHRNLSLSDSAELFVFLAGWSLRYAAQGRQAPVPADQLVMRLAGRAFTIYAAHLLIVLIAIAMLATASRLLNNPLLLEWHNAAAVFFDPVDTHIGLVLLTHQLGYFDILPLYVVLMLFAPAIVLIDRWMPRALLPLSLLIYFGALLSSFNLPTWPTHGEWFFSPLCWQLVFVLGFVLADTDRSPGRQVQAHIVKLRWIALPIVLGAALLIRFRWLPEAVNMPEPKLLFIAHKTFVTPLRLIQFLALVAVASVLFPFIARAIPRAVAVLSMLGRNSLHVFCAGSVLSLAGQLLRFRFHGNLAVDTVLVVTGIALMCLVAWLAEWRTRVQRAA